MANLTKTYYLPPTWDVVPLPGGPLTLGSVLVSTKRPLPPLLIYPVTKSTTPQPSSPSPETGGAAAEIAHPQIYSSTRQNISYETAASRSGSLSLFASFAAAVLGVGPDASVRASRDGALALHFARLDTEEWDPSAAELEARVRHPTVSRYLAKLRFWETTDLFVVTGVKVAYGARAESRTARETKAAIEVSMDPGVAGGIPGVVEFGPGAGLEKKRYTEVAWETGTDGREDPGFVFAYRVKRVVLKKKNGQVVDLESKDYTRGALYGVTNQILDQPKAYEIDGDTTGGMGTREEGVFVEAGDGDEAMWVVPHPEET